MPTVEVSTDQAQQLIRFGFALAELRGRVYFGNADPSRLLNPQPTNRTWHMPPLGQERSPAELRIQVINTIKSLATGVDDIDLQCKGDLTREEAEQPPSPLPTAVDQVIAFAKAVPDDPSNPGGEHPGTHSQSPSIGGTLRFRTRWHLHRLGRRAPTS